MTRTFGLTNNDSILAAPTVESESKSAQLEYKPNTLNYNLLYLFGVRWQLSLQEETNVNER